ncbi:MAG TPA: ATP synthase F1 subunit delta [Terriglobales bacterium]|nr:ATP synthase F1 subunit delta [Terriglobales bacterium]
MAAINNRYARALADVAVERKLDADQMVEEMNSLAQALTVSTELRIALETPSVPVSQKLKVLDAVVARVGASPVARNFLAVLVQNRRIGALGEIARLFEVEMNERRGFSEAEVTSWRDLGDEEKRSLTTRLEAVLGKKVQARYQKDESLLGGARIRVGSTIWDGSVRGQLRKLKEQLSSNQT